MTPSASIASTAPVDRAAARRLAAAYDADDAPLGARVDPLRLPDHATLAGEDTRGIRFAELLGREFRPVRPQDRIEHSWLAPPELDRAAADLIATLPSPVGHHNRYRPVPGEDALRTDDLLDFVVWYGHEYQILVFRGADVRTAALLDASRLTEAAVAEGASVMWDWTGAVDWAGAAPAEGVAAVFWADHHSLLDGRRIEAGVWRPADGPAPPEIAARPLPPSVAARSGRLAGFASRVFAGAEPGGGVRALHPGPAGAALPVLVLEAPGSSDAIADALAAGAGFRSVVRYGERVVALPDAGATYAEIGERAAEAAAVRS